MSKFRGTAALHCVITTYKGRAPDIRYYLAVYTEDLDHFHEIPLTSQQWRLALTTPLPIIYFDFEQENCNGTNETKPAVARDDHSALTGRYVRAADAGFRQQYEQAGVDHGRPRGASGNREYRTPPERNEA